MNKNVEKLYLELTAKHLKYELTPQESRDLVICRKYLLEKVKEKATGPNIEWERDKLAIYSLMAHATNDLKWQEQLKKDARILDKVIKNELGGKES